MLLAGLRTQHGEIAAIRSHGGPVASQFQRDQFLQPHAGIGVGRLRRGKRRADPVGPQHEAPPAQWRQRIDHRDRAHQQRGVAIGVIGQRIVGPMAHQVLQMGREQRVAQAAPQPLNDHAAAQGVHARLVPDRHGEGERARVPHLGAGDRQCLLRPPRRAGGNAAAARAGRVEQQAGRRPMLRVLGEHAADQIADDRRQALGAQQGGEGPDLELAAHDGRIVPLRQRHPPEAQAEQQHAERIDVVGNAAVAASCRHAHGGIGRLEQRRLPHARRRGPGGAEHHWLAGPRLEHVVEPNPAVGHTAPLELLQDQRRRSEHAFEQLGLRPDMRPREQARPGRRQTDHEAGLFRRTRLRGGGAVGQRDEQPVDRRGEVLQRMQPWRQMTLHPDRHQVGPPGALVGRSEGGQPAHGRQIPARIDRIPVGDQGDSGEGEAILAMPLPILHRKG